MVARDWVHRTPFYYGWVILAAATLGFVMTGAGQTFAFALSLLTLTLKKPFRPISVS